MNTHVQNELHLFSAAAVCSCSDIGSRVKKKKTKAEKKTTAAPVVRSGCRISNVKGEKSALQIIYEKGNSLSTFVRPQGCSRCVLAGGKLIVTYLCLQEKLLLHLFFLLCVQCSI